MNSKKLIFLELNELNFDIAKEYIVSENLNNLKKIISGNFIETNSESDYALLEPWIQWVTIHTGLRANEHKVFRLGDVVDREIPQIFEEVENKGYTVGAIMPMNTKNNLKKAKYFIPDAWTNTKNDGNFWSNILHYHITKIVNNNAKKKINLSSLFFLLICFLRFAKLRNYFYYTKLFLEGIKFKYNLAIFLDLFIHDVHLSLIKKFKVNFSTIFFNASAHIQHHFLFNSRDKNDNSQKNPDWYIPNNIDPFFAVLKLYDKIIGDYFKFKEYNLIVATGISQKKYDRLKFYYRLNNHKDFLKKIGVNFKDVFPRMTRDFLITFDNEQEAEMAKNILSSIKSFNEEVIFTEIEKRGESLFVVLGYPNEIKKGFFIKQNEKKYDFYKDVVFVALKNGMHSSKGFLYLDDSFEKKKYSCNPNINIIHEIILNFFNYNYSKYKN
jgi:hypothetical protein